MSRRKPHDRRDPDPARDQQDRVARMLLQREFAIGAVDADGGAGGQLPDPVREIARFLDDQAQARACGLSAMENG
jgi:hypothetical protein